MLSFRKRLDLPTEAEALPGRQTAMPVPARHFVNGNPLEGPFPEGMSRALFGMGCFWGAERKFWTLEGVYTSAAGYAGGVTPNPTYEEVCSGLTGHNEVVLVVFDPRRIAYQSLLEVFWESHDPTQGMRQGNDIGTQYRSGLYPCDDLQRAARRHPDGLMRAPSPGGLRRDHHRDPRRAGVLLRRALPPAVSRQEPARLLRAGRHPGALSGERLSTARPVPTSHLWVKRAQPWMRARIESASCFETEPGDEAILPAQWRNAASSEATE